MNKLIYTVGPPASGKTTWAKAQGIRRTNRDDIRRLNFPSDKYPGYVFSKENEDKVTAIQESEIRTALGFGFSIIVDDTNLNDKTVERLKNLAEEYGVETQEVEFTVPINHLLKRNLEREHSVPPEVIVDFYERQMRKQGRVIQRNDLSPDCIIVDIDGTIAEKNGRSNYEYSKVGTDKPVPVIIELVEDLSKKYDIIFLTGRESSCRKETTDWLLKNVKIDNFELFMREPKHGRIVDSFMKEDSIRENVLPYYNIRLWIEDRQSVVMHMRALGIKVLSVQNGMY